MEGPYYVSFNEHHLQYPMYHHQRAQTCFSCGSSLQRVVNYDEVNTVKAQFLQNFSSRSRKHVSLRRKKQEGGRQAADKVSSRIICRKIPRFECMCFVSLSQNIETGFQFSQYDRHTKIIFIVLYCNNTSISFLATLKQLIEETVVLWPL